MTSTPPTSQCRDAIIVFADALPLDLARRGWSRRAAPLLATPTIAIPGVDVHTFTRYAATDDQSRHRQIGRSFGERLENAVESLANAGYDRIVIVGRDCPELCDGDVRTAFDLLEHKRLVLGPDRGGGCYLIGLHRSDVGLLRRIRWQAGVDFQQLAARVATDALAVLEHKADLDSSADVHRIQWLRGSLDPDRGALSIDRPGDTERSAGQRRHVQRLTAPAPPTPAI